jgi:hypothetical protein
MREATSALKAASARAVQALGRLHEYGVPVGWPPGDSTPPRWDRLTISVILELHEAIGELITARREYDQMARIRGRAPATYRRTGDA